MSMDRIQAQAQARAQQAQARAQQAQTRAEQLLLLPQTYSTFVKQ